MINNAYIKAISYYLPDKILTNDQLVEEFPEWSVEKIASKVGVLERHIADSDETSSDLAYKAAKKLLSENNISPNEIDFVILCTQSPDYFLPTSACLLQNRLGIPTNVGAFDFNLGCSGYVYGLSISKGLVLSGTAKNILLLTANTYSKYLHPSDKVNRSIFGDGAAASLISTEGFARIGDFSLGTDGSGAENLIVKNGGSRNSYSINNISEDVNGTFKSSDHLFMNGTEIFTFTLDAVPPLINNTLEKCNESLDTIDYFIFHQANKFMLNTLRKVCSIDKSKFYINLENTGNIVSSTIPVALVDSIQNGYIKSGNKILIAGFGVGYSWGSTCLYLEDKN